MTDFLEMAGYEVVWIREVAAPAHVSTRTIHEASVRRYEMIAAALQHWMKESVKEPPEATEPAPGRPVGEGIMRPFRHIFAPWQHYPRLLVSVDIACRGQGVSEALHHVAVGLLGQFREGNVAITSLSGGLGSGQHRSRGLYLAGVVDAPSLERVGQGASVRGRPGPSWP
ncbi:hypothetical protein [Actinomadura rugatobispora]|uniref:Uncharacterized protein n=1 Tax=Actinomadura rugatobispora TaxID=1994 RepID=A0ABW1AA70_9ACTN